MFATERAGKVRWYVVARDGTVVRWSRVVMRNAIGRELRPEEIVHHINGRSDDDRLENLRLFASQTEHMAFEVANGAFDHYRVPRRPCEQCGVPIDDQRKRSKFCSPRCSAEAQKKPLPNCECGCGERVARHGRRFVRWHGNRLQGSRT